MSEQDKSEEFPDYVGELDKMVGELARRPIRRPSKTSLINQLTASEVMEDWLVPNMEPKGFVVITYPESEYIKGLRELLAAYPPILDENRPSTNGHGSVVIGKILSIVVYRDAKFPNNQIKVS